MPTIREQIIIKVKNLVLNQAARYLPTPLGYNPDDWASAADDVADHTTWHAQALALPMFSDEALITFVENKLTLVDLYGETCWDEVAQYVWDNSMSLDFLTDLIKAELDK